MGELERGRVKVTRQIEDELLAAWWHRRTLSEKALCARYGLARSTLQQAVRRARKRHAEGRG